MTAICSTTVLGSSTYLLLWSLVACSFVGVVVEGVFFLAVERVLESTSGLPHLPLRPLYGVGGCAFVLLLRSGDAQRWRSACSVPCSTDPCGTCSWPSRGRGRGGPDRGAALVLASAVPTVAALARAERRVLDRVLIDSLPPDDPDDELRELTRRQRARIRVPRHAHGARAAA